MLTSSGGYLKAMAQRGAREVEPSRRCTDDLVDLDDDAVDLVLDVVAVLARVAMKALHLVDGVDDPEVGGDRQAPRLEPA